MQKILVVCVLICLFGATVLPASYYNGIEAQAESTETSNQGNSDFSVDWWPMFHHDLCHTGFSTSSAPQTNHVKWSYTTAGKVHSSPTIVNGKLYVGSNDGKIYCLDADTGDFIWNYTTGNAVWSTPAIADEKLYVGSWGGKIYCLDADTGDFIWNYTTGDYVVSSPAIYNGKLYVGSGDCKIYCLDADTGKLIWNYTTSPVLSSPAIADGKVYVGADAKIYCLDAETGELIWNTCDLGCVMDSSPAVADGKVYVGAGGYIHCLDAETGESIWSYLTGGWVWSSPAIANGKIYVGSIYVDSEDGEIYCLDADTGELIWSYTTGGGVYSSPAIADGKLYVGSYDQKIYCLDADTGELIWSYTTGDRVESSPAIADGKLYVGSNDGKIYCFEDNHPPLVPDELYGPQNVEVDESCSYAACTTDPDGDNIYYLFDWGDDTTSDWLGPYESGEEVQANHSWSKRGTYEVKVKAKDVYGAESDWSDPLIVNVENSPPFTPGTPSGEQYVCRGKPHKYTACTADPDGDMIYYLFDWGDDNTSGWLGPKESGEKVEVRYSWSKRGTYEVRVKAKDVYGAESEWSDPLIVNVDNHPPLTPGAPSGQKKVKKGKYYTYTARTADPDGDMIYYKFDWGDGKISGWIGPKKSEEAITAEHSWSEKGTYEVRVKARDTYGAESNWSDPLTVTVTGRFWFKSFCSFWFLQWLMDHFPLLERLLKIFSSFQ